MRIIAAVDENFAIGYKNQLLYNIPEDLEFFKKTTLNSTVVMGRKTYFSLKVKPLPNRRNIVLSKNKLDIDAEICASTKELYDSIKVEASPIFVIGGQSVYELLMPFCRYAYITKIYAKSDKFDTLFPKFDHSWKIIENSDILTSVSGIKYQHILYENEFPTDLQNLKTPDSF